MSARFWGVMLLGSLQLLALGQQSTSSSSSEASEISKRHAAIASARKIPTRNYEQIVPYWTAEGGWHT